MKQLGGGSVFLDGPIGVREQIKDVARNLDRWVDGLVASVFLQSTVEGLAQSTRVPAINALSDLFPPCQALADIQTSREDFAVSRLGGLKLAFIGDGNNCPRDYVPNPEIVTQAEGLAAVTGAHMVALQGSLRSRAFRARTLPSQVRFPALAFDYPFLRSRRQLWIEPSSCLPFAAGVYKMSAFPVVARMT
jgi:hypothetical protein